MMAEQMGDSTIRNSRLDSTGTLRVEKSVPVFQYSDSTTAANSTFSMTRGRVYVAEQ
jgi:hypothetical protein